MTGFSRVQLTIEDDLRRAFEAAAEAEGRTASDVLLEMMAVYVEMLHHREGTVTRRALGLAQCTAAVTLLPDALEAVKLMLASNPHALADLYASTPTRGNA